jgi:hypothetical protein
MLDVCCTVFVSLCLHADVSRDYRLVSCGQLRCYLHLLRDVWYTETCPVNVSHPLVGSKYTSRCCTNVLCYLLIKISTRWWACCFVVSIKMTALNLKAIFKLSFAKTLTERRSDRWSLQNIWLRLDRLLSSDQDWIEGWGLLMIMN